MPEVYFDYHPCYLNIGIIAKKSNRLSKTHFNAVKGHFGSIGHLVKSDTSKCSSLGAREGVRELEIGYWIPDCMAFEKVQKECFDEAISTFSTGPCAGMTNPNRFSYRHFVSPIRLRSGQALLLEMTSRLRLGLCSE